MWGLKRKLQTEMRFKVLSLLINQQDQKNYKKNGLNQQAQTV